MEKRSKSERERIEKKNTKHKKGKNEELIQIFHDRNNKARQRKQRHVDKKKELFTGENRKRQKTP